MGRLENIVARNRRGQRPRERVIVSLGFSAFVLLILILLLFTDVNVPAGAQQPASTEPALERSSKRVDGVMLGGGRPKPAAPATPVAPTK